MAENRGTTEKRESSKDQGGMQRSSRQGNAVGTRRDPYDLFGSPFTFMRRMQDDFDRMFGTLGSARGLHGLFGGGERSEWTPAVEAFQRGNELVVRAEVPGLSRGDLSVEIGDDVLTISGERKDDREEEHEGVYRSERSYGSFYRTIPLPEGAVADSAKADFKDGVLEVVIQTPPQEVRRGRRVEIGQDRGDKQNPPRK
jgi:HSP20 family protein